MGELSKLLIQTLSLDVFHNICVSFANFVEGSQFGNNEFEAEIIARKN